MTIHEKACDEFKDRQEAARAAILATWPNICQACGGSGGWWDSYNDKAQPEFVSCPNCEKKNRCPRCAESMDTEDDGIEPQCYSCGWYVLDITTLPPPEPECICNSG